MAQLSGIRGRDPSELTASVHADGEPSGTGWTFTPPDAPTMLGAVDAALDCFHNRKDVWERVMQAGMAKDVSWERSAEQYEQIFNWAFIDNPIRYQ